MADGGWVATHEDITERAPQRSARPPPRPLRRADRPAQPRPVPRAAARRAGGPASAATKLRRALPRPRPVQGRQRHARPPGRRPGAEVSAPRLARLRRRDRFRGAARRRRVRHPADRGRRSDAVTEPRGRGSSRPIRAPYRLYRPPDHDRHQHRHRAGAATDGTDARPAPEERRPGAVRAPRATAAAPIASSSRAWTPSCARRGSSR